MTTPHTGLILSPFDKRWSSGIDWATDFAAPKKQTKFVHAQPPGFKEPKLTERKDAPEPRKPSKYKPKSERRPQSQSITAKIRALLAERGPMNRREIGSALNIASDNVPGMLQHDIALGRVRKNHATKPIQFVLIGPAE